MIKSTLLLEQDVHRRGSQEDTIIVRESRVMNHGSEWFVNCALEHEAPTLAGYSWHSACDIRHTVPNSNGPSRGYLFVSSEGDQVYPLLVRSLIIYTERS